MKKHLALLLIFLACVVAEAQEKVEVEVSEKEMSEGIQTAFTVFIPESSAKSVTKEWEKFINERSIFEFATKGTTQTFEKAFMGISNIFSDDKKVYSKRSLKIEERAGNELIAFNVVHEDISNLYLDVIAKISAVDSGVYVNSFIKYADSVFISEANTSVDNLNTIKEYIRQFGVETYKIVVAEQVESEEKELKKQEDILKDSKRAIKQLDKSIGRYDTEIDQHKYDTKVLTRELEGIEERLQMAKGALRNTKKKSEEYYLIKEKVKEVENERKKNLNSLKSNKNKISKNQSAIKDAENQIIANEKIQAIQSEVIKKKELRVEEYKTKYSNIK
ncbi:hypothetical protein OU798_17995 [Prolixibacteraceae bacterium Z1-6]|uniref:DUF4468 domain-containing protein n=1 Tax=Draconibacterium aestuarii TaxID=2998507 RepID=A0A9X3J870_9BACT|nr:hypothetical protein [Prolixibacteraceae bacterium Z1-6]